MEKEKGHIWTTKDGRKINVKDMEDEHLLNAQRMVGDPLIEADNFQHNAFVFAPSEDSMAYDDFEEALEKSYEREGSLHVWAKMLDDEIKRRGLEPLESRVKVDRLKKNALSTLNTGKL